MQVGSMSASYSSMNQTRPAPPSKEEKFSQVDADGSGGVSFEEFSADIQGMQDKMSSGDMPPPPPGGGQGMGDMTSEEMEELFSGADTDGDGSLTSEEFHSHMESLRPDPSVMQQMPGESQGGESFDSTEVLLEMMNSGEENSESTSSASNYLSQAVMNAYGLNSTSESSSLIASSLISASA